jgi:hypothetical protein
MVNKNLSRIGLFLFFTFSVFARPPQHQPADTGREQGRPAKGSTRVDFKKPVGPRTEGAPEVMLLASNAEGIAIEVNFPPYRIVSDGQAGGADQTIVIPGCSKTAFAGAPELPVKGVLIGIPAAGDFQLDVRGFEPSEASGYTLRPAPALEPRDKFSVDFDLGQAQDIRLAYTPDAKIYKASGFYPGALATLGPVGFMRSQRIVSVSVFPVQYSPSQKTIRFYKKVRFTLRFPQSSTLAAHGRPLNAEPGPFESILRSSLANYESAKSWRVMPVSSRAQSVFTPPTPGWKLFVNNNGIYRLTKPFLDSVGINLAGVDPKTLRVINRDNEIPIYVYGENDGTFDPGDYLEFYGVAETTSYTSNNVYWLTYGGAPGLRMGQKDGTPQDTSNYPKYFLKRLHFEENYYYDLSIAEGEGLDHWFWDYLIAPANKDYTLPIPFTSDTTYPAKVKVVLQGSTYTPTLPDHHAEVYLNGTKVTDLWWDGQTGAQAEVGISPTLLVAGNNTLRIRGPNDTGSSMDIFYINYFEVEYGRKFFAESDRIDFSYTGSGTKCFPLTGFSTSDLRLFDITDPLVVKRIVNGTIDQVAGSFRLRFSDTVAVLKRYYAITAAQVQRPKKVVKDTVSNWASSANQADYVIITNEDFYNAIQPLAGWWRSKGLNTIVVRLTDVYDEFNYGVADPQAIKDFLNYAYHSWTGSAPTYVLLVGDATFDPQDYYKLGKKDYLPTHFFQSSTYNFETASDNWFACVEGDDHYPEFLIGRITARTLTDVSQAVDKTLQYEQQVLGLAWQKKALFVSDNPDDAGDFEACSNELISHSLPTDFTPTKVYLTQCAGAADAKNKTISAINAGTALTTYFGHGSILQWATENMFAASDVASLTNNNLYPMFNTFTCLDGYFCHAYADYCLAEELARASTKGSVVCWAPTGYGYPDGHLTMGEALLDAFFKNRISTVGSAIVQAKLALLADTPSLWDHAEMFTLFGDPATEMIFTALPDLIPESITFKPRTAVTGDTVLISSIIRNDGRAPAGTSAAQFYDNGSPLGMPIELPPLVSQENTEVTFLWDTKGKSGLRTIMVMADKDDDVVESYEENNTISDTIRITDTTGVAEDKRSPSIEISIDGYKLQTNYGFISSRPKIDVTVNDNAGIDSSGVHLEVAAAGQKLALAWEKKLAGTALTLSSRPLLADGAYTLKVTAFDQAGNKAEKTVTVAVESKLDIGHVLAYPNPCQTRTLFTYLLSQPAQEVRISIYTLAGRRIREIRNAPTSQGFNSVAWDLRDEDGQIASNGVYFYRIIASGMDGERAEAVERLLILR